MQTRLSVCNQVLFLTLGKGFGKKLQALLWYLWPRPAAWVLAPIPHPKAPLTPQPPAGRCLLRSAQGKRKLTSLWKGLQHALAHGRVSGGPSHPPSPRVLLRAKVCAQGSPPAPRE